MQIFKYSYTGIVLTLAIFIYAFLFYISGYLESSESLNNLGNLIPYDSIGYVRLAENWVPPSLSLEALVKGDFNWLTLSYIYKLFSDIGKFGALIFILINSICFYFILQLGISAASRPYKKSQKLIYYPFLVLICSPYLFGWILIPNKELLITAYILISIQAISNNRNFIILILTAVIGFVKIQFVWAMLLYIFFKNFIWRKTVVFIVIGLIFPFLHENVTGLQMGNFIETNINEIRTTDIMLQVDSFTSYPLGYIFVFFVRLVLNIFAGLNPIRIIEAGFDFSILAPLTSFFLGILGLVSLFFIFMRNELWNILNSRSDKLFFIFCVFVVNLSLPFLQSRYYWWCIPIFLSYILFGKSRLRNF